MGLSALAALRLGEGSKATPLWLGCFRQVASSKGFRELWMGNPWAQGLPMAPRRFYHDAEDTSTRQNEEPQMSSQTPKSALAQLAEATWDDVPPATWICSFPRFANDKGPVVKMEALRKEASGIEKRILKTLSGKEPSGPLTVSMEAGMGIGKSFLIDIADQLFFLDEPNTPLVLKVTYNGGQALFHETASVGRAQQGLWARAVLAVHRKVPPHDFRTNARRKRMLQSPRCAHQQSSLGRFLYALAELSRSFAVRTPPLGKRGHGEK